MSVCSTSWLESGRGQSYGLVLAFGLGRRYQAIKQGGID